MNRWQLTIAAIVISSTGGCRLRQLRTANQDLERENFQLEQRLDEMTFQLEDAKAALACRGGDYVPSYDTRPTYAPSNGRTAPPDRRPPDVRSPAGDPDLPPSVELPAEETMRPRARLPREPVPRFAGPPLISPPDPKVPDGLPAASRSRGATAAPNEPTAESEAPAIAEPRLIGQNAAEEVASLVVNAGLTEWRKGAGGTSADGGLRVVVEPRDADGKLIAARGDIAIVVLDPVQEGPAARLGRWDFSAEETAKHFRGTKPGGGLHFALEWPGAAPTTDDLLLFVRLTTPGQQQFVAEFALKPANGVKPAAAWLEATNHSKGSAPQRGDGTEAKGWQRAARPLPVREEVSAVEPVHLAPAASESKSELDRDTSGPAWAPYR